ncbi:zinc finger protein 512 isoform X2 [Tiliqua scincoides]|uniref:zinc finger protein 512 isoform X2 n=1 Tax=Tiliqua scincoides TaxID=71010 RepID=UPI003463809B
MRGKAGGGRSGAGPEPRERPLKGRRAPGARRSKPFEDFAAESQSSASKYDESFSDSSSTSSKGLANRTPELGRNGVIRRPAYWLEMRGIKAIDGKSAEKKAGDSLSKAKHRLEQESEEDYEEFPRKKQKVPGSLEERWHLEILEKGRVTCPTCRAVVRKTVEGLKKHMSNCQQEMFTCHHCGKQLRSLAGMKYHVMAEHNSLPPVKESSQLEEQSERDRLRQVLKRTGKLKCTRESCTGSFTSIMGYLYHSQKCGKAAAELEKMTLKCHHCSKAYRSKAGLGYHLKSEHGTVPFLHGDGRPGHLKDASTEPNGGGSDGKVQRRSAKVAAYYLHELANEELVKEWPKRKVLQDLVPDDRKLKYTRPGLPAVSQEVLCKWRSEIKMYRRVHCPNQGCECVYSSISGLKAHLGTCTLGEFIAGKYKCLLCEKEFVSESGVKYHINTVHAEDWFDVNTNTTKSFEKLMKLQRKEAEQKRQRKRHALSRKRTQRTVSPKKPPKIAPEQGRRRQLKAGRSPVADSESRSSEEDSLQPLKHSQRRGKK